MKLTQEQENIVKAVGEGVGLIKINAFAGTGKTTTLLQIANSYPHKRILYLAFNKSMQLEAQNKFPNNTKVLTTHSLAFRHTVAKDKEFNVRNNYKSIEIMEMYDIANYEDAQRILKFFENYCNSSYKDIEQFGKDTMQRKKTIEVANTLFNDMLTKKIDITHSFYLKLFQLTLLQSNRLVIPYDIVMLDEAQDTNDVTLSIFYNLRAKQKIVVGDKHQQIYGFRGSINAMNKVSAKVFNLTQSFRFTNEIAKNATNFLQTFKGEKLSLKGIENPKTKGDMAYLTRTNGTLIEIMDELEERCKEFRTVREPENIFGLALSIIEVDREGFDAKLQNAFKFLLGLYKKAKDEASDFINYLITYAKESDDMELLSSAMAVKKFKSRRIRYLYKVAKEQYPKKVKLNLSTMHTSKGLEWDKVEIWNDIDIIDMIADTFAKSFEKESLYTMDFVQMLQDNLDIMDNNLIEELNLFYVAMTRARKKVIDHTKVIEMLNNKDAINEAIRELAIEKIS